MIVAAAEDDDDFEFKCDRQLGLWKGYKNPSV